MPIRTKLVEVQGVSGLEVVYAVPRNESASGVFTSLRFTEVEGTGIYRVSLDWDDSDIENEPLGPWAISLGTEDGSLGRSNVSFGSGLDSYWIGSSVDALRTGNNTTTSTTRIEVQGPSGVQVAFAAKRGDLATGIVDQVQLTETEGTGIYTAWLSWDDSDIENEPLGPWAISLGTEDGSLGRSNVMLVRGDFDYTIGGSVAPTGSTGQPADIITRMRKQVAVLWEYLTADQYGQPIYRAPVEVPCRWDDVASLFISSTGEEQTSAAIVYPDRRPTIGSRMRLGPLTDAVHANPLLNQYTFEVRQIAVTPNLKNTNQLYTVYLG